MDFPKPLAFTDIWHNKNDFKVVFTKDNPKAKRCEFSLSLSAFVKGC